MPLPISRPNLLLPYYVWAISASGYLYLDFIYTNLRLFFLVWVNNSLSRDFMLLMWSGYGPLDLETEDQALYGVSDPRNMWLGQVTVIVWDLLSLLLTGIDTTYLLGWSWGFSEMASGKAHATHSFKNIWPMLAKPSPPRLLPVFSWRISSYFTLYPIFG